MFGRVRQEALPFQRRNVPHRAESLTSLQGMDVTPTVNRKPPPTLKFGAEMTRSRANDLVTRYAVEAFDLATWSPDIDISGGYTVKGSLLKTQTTATGQPFLKGHRQVTQLQKVTLNYNVTYQPAQTWWRRWLGQKQQLLTLRNFTFDGPATDLTTQ